ncbi:MAG: hypothetical protein Q8M77_14435 [Hydrogenophaga sp.]|nr:hypothetical protein [Hydrogenophaga sp.]
MNMKKSIWILLVAFALAACSKKIDGTNLESFDASLKEITRDLSAEDVKQFRSDLYKASRMIGKSQNLDAGAAMLMALNPQAQARLAAENLHGKTVGDIRRMAKEWEEYERDTQIKALKEDIASREHRSADIEERLQGVDRITFDSVRLAPASRSVTIHHEGAGPAWYLFGRVTNHSSFELETAGFDFPVHESLRRRAWIIDFDPPLAPGESRDVNDQLRPYEFPVQDGELRLDWSLVAKGLETNRGVFTIYLTKEEIADLKSKTDRDLVVKRAQLLELEGQK